MRWPGRRSRPGPTSVVFVTRRGCSLCDAAKPVVARAAVDAGIPFEVRDVDADPEDRARWSDQVPVVLLDGPGLAERMVARRIGLRPQRAAKGKTGDGRADKKSDGAAPAEQWVFDGAYFDALEESARRFWHGLFPAAEWSSQRGEEGKEAR